MKHKIHPKILEIAEQVREEAETLCDAHGADGSYPRTGWDDCLCGLCAVSAYRLTDLLREAGFEAVFCATQGHCFTKIGKWIVDVTATQFGYDRIHYFEVHGDEHYDSYKNYDEIEFENIDRVMGPGWNGEQHPSMRYYLDPERYKDVRPHVILDEHYTYVNLK